MCKFSGMVSRRAPLVLDSSFVTEYLPHADSDAIKVYLLGLSYCQQNKEEENSLDRMAKVLDMSEERVVKAFSYWQDLGLVQVVAKEPLEVRYLPLEAGINTVKKYKTDKYHDFNKMLQTILSGREILPNEYNEYYYFLESRHFEPEAFLCVVRYCTLLKGESVRYPYVLQVAKSFAEEGVLTQKAVEEKLSEFEGTTSALKSVLRALGLRREPDPEERKLYIKWTKSLGFSDSVLLFVARAFKGKGVAAYDAELQKYYGLKLFTIPEIENFSASQEETYALAKEITRTIGVYYQNLDKVVEVYVSAWLQMGFDKSALLLIADHCFKKSIRTLEGVHVVVQKFFKLGLVTVDAIQQYVTGLADTDEIIASILEKCGLLRKVNSWDRDFYRTWTYQWNLKDNIIMLAAEKAKGKDQPMAYLNKLLTGIHAQNITNEAEVKKYLEKSVSKVAEKASDKMLTRTRSEQELSALFDSLDDIEV